MIMKSFTSSMLLCLIIQVVTAQTYWETFEDSGFIYNSSVSLLSSDAAGNVYSYGNQPLSLYPTGYYLDKKDEDGNVQWKLDIPYSVILFMKTTSTGITFLLSEVVLGEEAAWQDKEYTIYAYDTDGELLWQKILSMPLYDFESMNEESMVVDQSGNISVAVYVFNQNEEPGYLEEVEDAKVYIAKIKGNNGATLKQALHEVPLLADETTVRYLRVDTKGNVYLYIDNFGDDHTFYKYNTSLAQVWANDMGDYLPREIMIDKNKFIYMINERYQLYFLDSIEIKKYDAVTGGLNYSSATPVLLYDGTTSNFSLVNTYLDKAGNLIIPYMFDGDGPLKIPCLLKIQGSDASTAFHIEISTATPGDEVDPWTNKIGIGPLNEIIVGGFVETSYDVYTPICFKYSKTGVKIWEHVLPEDPINEKALAQSFSYTGLGHMVMGGQFSTPGFYNARYTVSFDGSLTVRQPGPAAIVSEQDDLVSLFPNPAADFVQLMISADLKINKISTYTLEGKRVPIVFDETLRSEVQNLAAGMYVTVILTDAGEITEKWLKQ